MKMIPNKLASLLPTLGVWAGSWLSTAAYAVNDLPGGPAVLQTNLPPAVTNIAREQQWLHWFMLIVCTVIFIAVFGDAALRQSGASSRSLLQVHDDLTLVTP